MKMLRNMRFSDAKTAGLLEKTGGLNFAVCYYDDMFVAALVPNAFPLNSDFHLHLFPKTAKMDMTHFVN
jgi:hypothetical protein